MYARYADPNGYTGIGKTPKPSMLNIEVHGFHLFWLLFVPNECSFTGRFYFPRLVAAMSEPFLALALGKENAIQEWRALIGPTHVYRAQWQHPECLRAKYGISGKNTAVLLIYLDELLKQQHRYAQCLPWIGQ